MSSIKYRPEIDGLRALAVLPVILFHFNPDWLPGGYIGVDVFFVISGFLITSIILDEKQRGVFRFSNFWLRRVNRILPALITMVLATMGFGSLVLAGSEVNNLYIQGLAALLSFANISHYLLAGDYWGFAAETSPLLHTWSLSVEEQFYLVFPLMLVVALTYFKRRLCWIFSLFTFCSFVLFLIGSETHPSGTFYLLPTRAWELGIGGILAILFSRGYLQVKDSLVFSVCGLVAVLVSYCFLDGKGGISPFLFIPVLGAAVIIMYAQSDSNGLTRLLSLKPLVYTGKVSYSLYLWHWPILVLSKQFSLRQGVEIYPVIIALSIAVCGVGSYHFIERPTRRKRSFTPYILGILALSVGGLFFLKNGEYAENTSFFEQTEWDGNRYNVNPVQEWSESVQKRMIGITSSQNDAFDSKAFSSTGIVKDYGTPKPEILVMGDSHSLMWARVLDEVARGLGLSIAFFSADGTPTFFKIPPEREVKGNRFFSADQKLLFDQARLRCLEEWKPRIVVISCNWSRIDLEETRDLMDFLQGIGSKVLLIEQPPPLFFGDKNAPQFLSYLGLRPLEGSPQYIRHVETQRYRNGIALIQQLVNENRFCFRIATSDLFLSDGKVLVLDSRKVLYVDDDHLSYAGAVKAKERIREALEQQMQ